MISTTPLTDRDLLAAFVKNADGGAFAALTERHLGLVFGVACRRTGSREMAQEAAQNTFCRLARHAPKLEVGNSLGPWLHAVALREAGTLLRAEAARQRAMQRLASSAGPLETGGFSAPPPPGSEHLDEALAALPEAARRVLVLRYLQGMSLREVSIEENTSEEAVRKRVTRALERLTRSLARRGVTAAGVTACLATTNVLWPTPSSAATLAARAIKQAAAPAPAAGAGLSGMAGFALSQWPVAAVFLLTAIPAAWPWRSQSAIHQAQLALPPVNPAVHSLTDEINWKAHQVVACLQKEIAMLSLDSRKGSRVDFTLRDYQASVWISGVGPDMEKLAAIRRAVLDLSLEEVRVAGSLPQGGGWQIADAVYARWEELQPGEGLRAAAAAGSHQAMAGALRIWARKDAGEALRWIRLNASEGSRKDLQDMLQEEIARSNPTAYLQLLESRTFSDLEMSHPTEGREALATVMRSEPVTVLQTLRRMELAGPPSDSSLSLVDRVVFGDLPPTHMETILAFANKLPRDSRLRRECLQAASLSCAEADPAKATHLLADIRTETEDPQWKSRMTRLLTDWKAVDTDAVSRWLAEQEETANDTFADLARSVGIFSTHGQHPNDVSPR